MSSESGSSITSCPERKFFMQNLNLFSLNQPKSLLEIYHSKPGWQKKKTAHISVTLSYHRSNPAWSPLPFFNIPSKFSLPLSVPRSPAPHPLWFLCTDVLYWWCDHLISREHLRDYPFSISILKSVFFLYIKKGMLPSAEVKRTIVFPQSQGYGIFL